MTSELTHSTRVIKNEVTILVIFVNFSVQKFTLGVTVVVFKRNFAKEFIFPVILSLERMQSSS